MNNQPKEDIDKYSIFELMGLKDLTLSEQQDFLAVMEENIWTEFLFLRLNKILSEDDLSEVQDMLSQKKELTAIVSFIETKAPNFKNLLLDFTRDAKIETIQKQFTAKISELKSIGDDASKYEQALDLVEENHWEELRNFWG